MGVERNRRVRRGIGSEASDDDVEEEKVGSWNGEEEVTCVAHGLEVGELVGELGDGGEVVLVAIEDDLRVGLGQVRETGRIVEKSEEEIPIKFWRAAAAYVFPAYGGESHVLFLNKKIR
ncbi:hypothetical protein ACFX2A_017703 [Malus domestica]